MVAHLLEAVPWASAAVLLPLGGATLAFAAPRAGRLVALLTALGIPALAAALTVHVARHGPQRYRVGGWGPPLGIDWHLDGLSALLLLLCAAVWCGATLYGLGQELPAPAPKSGGPQAPGRPRDLFWPLWLFAWAALNGLFLSADAFNLYVCLELLGLAAIGLVAQEGTPEALAAALRYLLLSLLGSFSYLLGVVFLYAEHATLDFVTLGAAVQPGPVTAASAALVTAGLLLKAAVFPLHTWLPPAHGNAPAPVSAVLSALVVKAAFYVFLRLWLPVLAPAAPALAGQFLGALGATAVIWGSLLALTQKRLKLVVAYSTAAQMGTLFLVFPLAGEGPWTGAAWAGGVCLALSHGLAKAGMFLAAGTLAASIGHDRTEGLAAGLQGRPLSAFSLAAASASLMGLPPSGGFVGKWFLLHAALESGQWWWAVTLGGGGLLTAAYCFRMLAGAFAAVAEPAKLRPVRPILEWTSLGLSLGALLLGFATPWLLPLVSAGYPLPGPFLPGMPP